MVITMVSHICLLVELGPICNSMAASLCLNSCEDHSLLKIYNGGLWKNNYRSVPFTSIVRQPYTSLGFVRLSYGDLNRNKKYRILWVRRMAENGFAPPPPREFRRHILSCRELKAESFKRCLHSVLRGVSL